MDFSHTKLSFKRPLSSYSKVREFTGTVLRNRRAQIKQDRIRSKEYLDIGCGPNPHEEFINLDYGWHPKIDICWDVTRGIPLADSSVKGIFTEHCFEHLPFGSMEFILRECLRVLKPGGTLRIIVPDGELYLSRYTEITRGKTELKLPEADVDKIGAMYSPILSVNRIFRSHGHLFIYDYDLFRQLLEKCGFVNIKKETCGSGRDPRLLIDTPAREVESLYVEASKPGAAIPQK